MSKVSRREYLKQMGVAGMILGMDEFGSSVTGRFLAINNHGLVEPAAPNGILRWPVIYTPPAPRPLVTALFQGLMGFCYNTVHDSNPVVEVGFHPGHGHHSLDIKLFKIPDQNPMCMPVPMALPKNIKEMTLKVEGASGVSPNVFQKKDEDPFDRWKGDAQDFRWLPDFDSVDFYPEGYAKNRVYKPRLYVNHGTFYTHAKSNSTFKLIDLRTGKDLRRFGHVAMVMAAAIAVKGNDYVSFQVNDETPFPIKPEAGFTYQLVFKNECTSCKWDINNTNEEQRNDFHFNRKVVRIPSGRTKYALKIDQEMPGSQLNVCPDNKFEGTDAAPCMGSGYGQTPEFPGG